MKFYKDGQGSCPFCNEKYTAKLRSFTSGDAYEITCINHEIKIVATGLDNIRTIHYH